MNKNKIRI